jgi:L-ascorbate metabolism protein UlaG (beta-lactamase superfamily)
MIQSLFSDGEAYSNEDGSDIMRYSARDSDLYAGRKPSLILHRLGQQGYILEISGCKIGIDLYLSESKKRLLPNFTSPEDLLDLKLLFGTHDHLDHIDRPVWTLLSKINQQLKFVVPAFLKYKLPDEMMIAENRFIFIDEGTDLNYQGIDISAITAAHEFIDEDPISGYHPYLCYLISWSGYKIFHAGDTCIYEGFESKIKRHGPIHVAFLPINGRDAQRYRIHCLGNMTFQEAADLAGSVKPCLTIPGHYDMFAHNSEDPIKFMDYMAAKYPDLKSCIIKPGEKLIFNKCSKNITA